MLISARHFEVRVVGEAALPMPGGSNLSLDNQVRAGLRVAYHQQNWIWRAAADPS
jgi:hypothetical protein